MRYRALSATGDYTFGANGRNFLVNSPATVAQAVQTRLLLFQGEWFMDLTQGVPWSTEVLGKGTTPYYDLVMQSTITGTEGVQSLLSYSSALDRVTRSLTVNAVIKTIYGIAPVTVVLRAATGFGITPFGMNFGDPQ